MTDRETRSFRSYDGTRLAYHLLGAGPPLLCVPGGPGRASTYLRDLGGLSARHTLVQLDSRGSGLSAFPDDPATLSFDRLPADVEALRAELGGAPLPVLGHSAGALVALLHAARHPAGVTGLVLVTPSARLHGVPRADLDEIQAARAGEPWYAAAAAARDALAADPVEGRGELERLVRPFYYGRWDDAVAAHAHAAEREMSPRAARGFGAAAVDRSALLTEVAAVRVPTLVVGGGRDGLAGVAGSRAVAQSVPGARLALLDGAGHFPWIDAAESFRAEVEGFLGGLAVRAGGGAG